MSYRVLCELVPPNLQPHLPLYPFLFPVQPHGLFAISQINWAYSCLGPLHWLSTLLEMLFSALCIAQSFFKSYLNITFCARFSSTYTKIGTIQRLAWPLHKDDTQIREAFHIFETSAQAWCTGKTLCIQVEREVGGGIGMGNTCNSMADSCQCMTKPTEML